MIVLAFLLSFVNADQFFGIKYPMDLATKEELKNIQFVIANFGFVPYGQRISGTLVLAQPFDFCKPEFTATNQTTLPDEEYKDVKILLVKRGECTFYQKTINAQLLGYQMLVIVNDKDEEITKLNLVSLNSTQEIDIPAILITQKQGEALRSYIEQNQEKKIHVFVRFPEMLKTEIVNYQYWLSSMDSLSYQFLEQFYPFHMKMKQSLDFTPHYAITQCGYCKKEGYKSKDQLCLSGGRYCAIDPDGDGPLTGQDAVLEIVRQLCIFSKSQNQWWKYVIRYADFCLGAQLRQTCYKDIMDWINIDSSDIEKCIKDSFNGDDIELADNKILKNELEQNQLQSVNTYPTLLINGLRYKGSLSVPTYTYNYETGAQEIIDTAHFGPLQTICRSFSNTSLPDICKERMVGYINEDGEWVNHSVDSNTWLVWVIVLTTMIILMLCTTFFYKRWFKKEAIDQVGQQVNIHLANYYALAEKEKSMRN